MILDLDNTLIHCPSNLAKVPRSSLIYLKSHHMFIGGELHVIFERPYLKEFFQSLAKFNIAVWTAAEETYARFVVDDILKPYLNPNQKFEFVWSREACNLSEEKYGVLKHLDMVLEHFPKYSRGDIAIIDDNTDLLAQKNNVYVIPKFYSSNIHDSELVVLK